MLLSKKLILGIFLLSILLFSGCSTNTEVELEGSIPVNVTNLNLIHNGTTILTEDYNYAVASGEVNSATVWNKFGYNNDLDVATSPEIIAEFGGDNSFILDNAEFLNISSTSSDDVNGGIGAHGLIIYGVNDEWIELTEVIFLNGTNSVQTANEFRGVNRMALFRAGSTYENQGVITALASNSGSIQAEIPEFAGTTEQAFLFVQANHTFLADYLLINVNKLSGGSSPKISIDGWVRSYVSNAEYDVFEMTIDTSVENTIEIVPNQPFIISEKSVLYFMATTDTNNAIITMRFSGIEKHND